jgi:hypothetical protein
MRNAVTWNFETVNLSSLLGVCGMHIRMHLFNPWLGNMNRQDVPFGRLLSALMYSKSSNLQLPAARKNNNGEKHKTASQQTHS